MSRSPSALSTGRAGLMLLAAALGGAGCTEDFSSFLAVTSPERDPSLRRLPDCSDEFDGPAGDPPRAALWSHDIGNGKNGWGNNELEYYTDRPDNASLDGAGHLRIVARSDAAAGLSCGSGPCTYTSARLQTKGKCAEVYGHIEARIRLPRGKGIWPAFWMLGDNIDQVPWPGCGEVDIMENSGSEPSIVHGSMHGPGYSGAGGVPLTGQIGLLGAELADDYHVYAIDWTEAGVRFLLDGKPYETQLPSVVGDKPWVFDHRFFLLLNLAVGGNFVNGAPDGSTLFPQTMLVDYVRWYQKK